MIPLTIITINRNNASGLQKTIASVINQTFSNFEYIIIDGTSDDNSVDIIKKNDKYIDSWLSEPDNGIYHAMNKGIALAQGEYILFQNSGDYLYDNNVLQLIFSYNFYEDILYGDLIIDLTNGKEKSVIFPDKLTFYHLFTEYIGHNSTLISRRLFNEIGYYNEKLNIVADWEFFLLALAKYNCSSKHVPVTVSMTEGNGISRNSSRINQVIGERTQVMQNHFPIFFEDYIQLQKTKELTLKKKLKQLIK